MNLKNNQALQGDIEQTLESTRYNAKHKCPREN